MEWFLSIDENDLPKKIIENRKPKTFRNISIDGEELEFSDGFTDLHTSSYEQIINGRGFGLDIASNSIELVEKIRNTQLSDGS